MPWRKRSAGHPATGASSSSSTCRAAGDKDIDIYRENLPELDQPDERASTQLFERLKRARSAPALIAYLTAGDPSPERTPGLVAALERGGADLIELGVPFSDPVADGPVIQRAADRALEGGHDTCKGAGDRGARSGRHREIPLLLFTYLNPAAALRL